MNRLPDEILLRIFRSIDDFRQLIRLERVCRRWHKIMRVHGWKHVRRVAYSLDRHTLIRYRERPTPTPTPDKWMAPFGERCGNRLVECSLYSVTIDSNLMRLIAANLPTLRHLKFNSCQLQGLDENVLDPFPEFCTRLRSVTFFKTQYQPQLTISHSLFQHFPSLRHLGLYFLDGQQNYVNDISRHFSVKLRSLYLNCDDHFGSEQDLLPMLAKLQTDSPGLAALYLDTFVSESVLRQISALKSLRFLNMGNNDNPGLLSSCLASLPQLRALQMHLFTEQLSDVFCSQPFHSLIHLSLTLDADDHSDFGPIGLLSTVAPQLRSLSLNIFYEVPEQIVSHQEVSSHHKIGCQLLNFVRNSNGTLEHLNVPSASFSIAAIVEIVRRCPNLHSLCAGEEPAWGSEVAELRHLVMDQWREGTRKHLPLQIWAYEHAMSDPFLAYRYLDIYSMLNNPVLDTLFREEVFNSDQDGGGTPSFVSEYVDGQPEPRAPPNDLMIF